MKKKIKITSIILASTLAVVVPVIAVSTVLVNQKNKNQPNRIITNVNDNANFDSLSQNLSPIFAGIPTTKATQDSINALVDSIKKDTTLNTALTAQTTNFPSTLNSTPTISDLSTYVDTTELQKLIDANADVTFKFALSNLNDVTGTADLTITLTSTTDNSITANTGSIVISGFNSLNSIATKLEALTLTTNATGQNTLPTNITNKNPTLTDLSGYISNTSDITALIPTSVTATYSISATNGASGTIGLTIDLTIGAQSKSTTEITISGFNTFQKSLDSLATKIDGLPLAAIDTNTLPSALPTTSLTLTDLGTYLTSASISSIQAAINGVDNTITSAYTFSSPNDKTGTVSLEISLTWNGANKTTTLSNISGFNTYALILDSMKTNLEALKNITVTNQGLTTLPTLLPTNNLDLTTLNTYINSEPITTILNTNSGVTATYSFDGANDVTNSVNLIIVLSIGSGSNLETSTVTISNITGFQTQQQYLTIITTKLQAIKSLTANSVGANTLVSSLTNDLSDISKYVDTSAITSAIPAIPVVGQSYTITSQNNAMGTAILNIELTLGTVKDSISIDLSGFASYQSALQEKANAYTNTFTITTLGSSKTISEIMTLYNGATSTSAKQNVISQYINLPNPLPSFGNLDNQTNLPITSYFSLLVPTGGYSSGTLDVVLNLSVDLSKVLTSPSTTNNIVTATKNFSVTGFPIVAFYKPSSLTFQTNANNWDSSFYPSQITGAQIKQILDSALTNSNVATPTTSVSGYQLQLGQTVDGTTTYKNVTNTELATQTGGFSIGAVANPLAFSRINIVINSYNNALGTVNFSVYEQLQSYQDQNGIINPSQNSEVNAFQVQSLILPPSQYEGPTGEWTLPTIFAMKKLSYNFAWNSDQQIGDFINSFPSSSANVTAVNIVNNFFTLTPSVADTLTPNFAIVLDPTTNNGYLQVTINFTTTPSNPAQVFFNGSAITTITKTFYGFKMLTSTGLAPAAQIELSMPSNTQLLSAIITQQYWSTNTTPPGSAGSPNTAISKMLPSDFVNPINPPTLTNPFLSIFTGVNPGISILNSSGTNVGYIGNLTYLGQPTGSFTGFPTFNITQVQTFPNDKNGTLEIVVYYNQISPFGNIVAATPLSFTYTGFQENSDSGKTLSFSWLSSIPSQYSSLTAVQILGLYKELTGQSSVDNDKLVPSTISAAKNFVANFFIASSDTMTIYNNTAAVTMSPSPVNSNQIIMQVSFPSYNGNQFTTQNIYNILGVVEVTPASTITLNPAYLSLTGNPFKDVLPSNITDSDIEGTPGKPDSGMITIKANNSQTSTVFGGTNGITIFAVPNDKTGELFVTFVFPQFNGIQNFGFSQLFSGFKKNILLSTNLVIPYISNINLPASFMNLDPEDTAVFTAQTILNALVVFNSSNTLLSNVITSQNINITKRTPDTVDFTLTIDWQSIINSSSTQSLAVTNSQSSPSSGTTGTTSTTTGTSSGTNSKNSDTVTMDFTISGFTGGTNTTDTNQTPLPNIVPNNTLAYGLGIGLSLSAILGIILAVAFIVKRRRDK